MSAAPIGSPAAALEGQLGATDRVADPTGWSLLAGRVALARSELGDSAGALVLVDQAAAILTATRAPLEHARLLVTAAAAHRALGNPVRAFELFEAAAQLLAGRATAPELAAALSNIGLVAAELGRTGVALAAFDDALESAPDDAHRLRASLHINRAQLHLAGSGHDALDRAAADFQAAAAISDMESTPIQHGQAHNGLGTVAQARGDRAGAAGYFSAALATFAPAQFPFLHAVASHNLGLALSDPDGTVVALRRALSAFEVALTLFDPQRQRAQWTESFHRAEAVEAILAAEHAGWTRDDHLAALLGGLDEGERLGLARTRLGHIAQRPDPHRRRAFATSAAAALRRDTDTHRAVLHATVSVLMELPDDVLRSGLQGQLDAHQALDDPVRAVAADEALDDAIHALLHGPQRVRVRDLLEEMGWERP